VERKLEPASEAFLNSSWGIWLRSLAHLVLNESERIDWYALSERGTARYEWLMKQILMKDLVREWAEKNFQVNLAPIDVTIKSTPHGSIIGCEALRQFPKLSVFERDGILHGTAKNDPR
jgi:hypothetical protein